MSRPLTSPAVLAWMVVVWPRCRIDRSAFISPALNAKLPFRVTCRGHRWVYRCQDRRSGPCCQSGLSQVQQIALNPIRSRSVSVSLHCRPLIMSLAQRASI